VDDTDVRILKALVANGRATFAALGAEVGLSPHGAADRVRRLRAAGVITGFTATVDLERIGRRLDAMVEVRLGSAADPDAFEAEALRLAAVRELAFVTGRFDYQLRVACADADELDQAVRALRRAGAVQTETKIVMRSVRRLAP
jgi:Lrp/AsnC family leucine-responsive transcriptional regulator